MANGVVIVNNGLKVAMHRLFDLSPAYTAPQSFKVGTGTTTPAAGDTVLGTPITISGQPTKAIASGYPVFDDGNMQITNRCILLVTECNGNSITEFGLVNQDATPLLFSHAVFPAVAKTSGIQLVFVEKDLVTRG